MPEFRGTENNLFSEGEIKMWDFIGEHLEGCLYAFVLIAIVILFAGCTVATYSSVTYVDGTITGMPVQHGNTFFTIKLDNGSEEIFSNHDDWLLLKVNSGDYLFALKPGGHYRLKVNWFRFPLFSMYRNIVGFEQTPAPQQK